MRFFGCDIIKFMNENRNKGRFVSIVILFLVLVGIGGVSLFLYNFFIKEQIQKNDLGAGDEVRVSGTGSQMRDSYDDWVAQTYKDSHGNIFYFGVPKNCNGEFDKFERSYISYACQVSNKEVRLNINAAMSSGKWYTKEDAIYNYITHKYLADSMKGSSSAKIRKEIEFTNPNGLKGYEIYLTKVESSIDYLKTETREEIIESPSFLVNISNDQNPKFIAIEGDENIVRQIIKTITYEIR